MKPIELMGEGIFWGILRVIYVILIGIPLTFPLLAILALPAILLQLLIDIYKKDF